MMCIKKSFDRWQPLVASLVVLMGFHIGLVLTAMAQSTTRVSVTPEGGEPNDHSGGPFASADGRYIAFSSDASNLVPGDNNGATDVFVFDRETGLTTRVSVTPEGGEPNDHSGIPSLSADGRFVAFPSRASNLVAGDNNGVTDIFLFERQTGITTRLGPTLESNDTFPDVDLNVRPAMNADGRFVAFSSDAPNLVPEDTNGIADVFVYDRKMESISRVSVTPEGGDPNGRSGFFFTLSADGRYVAFDSNASNLVETGWNQISSRFLFTTG